MGEWVCGNSQAEQQGEAGDVLVPLGSEKLHVNVLNGGWVVGNVHFVRHTVLPHLSERICTQTHLQCSDRSHTLLTHNLKVSCSKFGSKTHP